VWQGSSGAPLPPMPIGAMFRFVATLQMTETRNPTSTAHRLAYPKDARVLIINRADDFGTCHDGNEATIEGLTSGFFTSATCPRIEEVGDFARNHPSADLGVPLTLTGEWERYKSGPVLSRGAVPSLVVTKASRLSGIANCATRCAPQEARAEWN